MIVDVKNYNDLRQAKTHPKFPKTLLNAGKKLYISNNLSCQDVPDRQCMYNVTLRGFRATIFAVEKKTYYTF